MKIICTQENLKSGLSVVGRIAVTSSTLPILSNLLIKTENGLLKISSTNLEIAISTQIRCKVEDQGAVTVINKTLSDLVSNLPNSNISLQSDGGNLKLETDNYHTSIKTLPAEEFPLIPELTEGQVLFIDAQVFKLALEQVVFAASTNQTQPEISGVLLYFSNKQLKVVATDRYRLAEKKIVIETNLSGEQQLIIPQKTMLEVVRIIGNNKGDMEIKFSETQISFTFNDTQIVSRLVDGQYPDYQQIIPSVFTTTVTVRKQDLISALKTVSVFSQSSKSVKFQFLESGKVVVLEAESAELGGSRVEIPVNITGQDMGLVLNYHYILDCLQSVSTENVIIKLVNDNSPGLIVPENNDDYTYLIMPIKS